MMRLAALALLAAAPALAQERPPTSPTRDVDVVYHASVGGETVEQRSRFAITIGKVRIDTPSQGLYVIIDREAKQMDMVSAGDQSVLQLPFDPARTVSGVPGDRQFERLGGDVIAGVPCTEWRTADRSGHPIILCMSADGVMLRARAGASVMVQAMRVTYGPIEPSVFAIPPGYQRRARAAAP